MRDNQAAKDAVAKLLRSHHANAQEASVLMMQHVDAEKQADVRQTARRRAAMAKPTSTDSVNLHLDRMIQFEIADARHNDPRGRD